MTPCFGGRARSTLLAAAASIAAMFLGLALSADGHCYILDPVSRSYWYTAAFTGSAEEIEYCPGCMNAMGPESVINRAIKNTPEDILEQYGGGTSYPLYWAEHAENGNYLEPQEISVRHGVCGDPKQRTEEGWNRYSTPNSIWPIQKTFEKGSVMEMTVMMNAYHWGHLEFFLCDAAELDDPDGVVTQECLNMNPLTRAEGDNENSPIDPDYSGRYYVDPECHKDETDQGSLTPEDVEDEYYLLHMRYQLPNQLVCEHCILQMKYYTGNTCNHVGYDEFDPSSWPSECAPDKDNWIRPNLKICGEGDKYPEEFFSCSDISITENGERNPTPAPSEPIPDCLDPVELFEQCGGGDWQGSECCRDGFDCVFESESYSECRLVDGECSEEWGQCGGSTWDGPTCCWPGATCVEKKPTYSQCRPDEDDDGDEDRL